MDKQLLLICSCYSPEHQIIVHLDEGGDFYPPEAYVRIHLVRQSFWYRLMHAIKYVLGYKSKYGAWDEFILDKTHAESLREIAKHLDDEKLH